MSGARGKKKTAEDRLRDQVGRLSETVAARERAITAQQSELEELRAMVSELTAPKSRPFRARKIIHGPLDITIKGTDVAEAEVVIEHVGGYLAVRIGDAIGQPAGVIPRTAYSFTPAEPQAPQPYNPAAPPQVDLMAARLASVGVNDLTAIDTHGLANGDPTIVNVALAPQADPRRPGGFQHRTAEAAEAAASYGWSGVGPKPPGWRDPDAANDAN